jgi:hypothetical protein
LSSKNLHDSYRWCRIVLAVSAGLFLFALAGLAIMHKGLPASVRNRRFVAQLAPKGTFPRHFALKQGAKTERVAFLPSFSFLADAQGPIPSYPNFPIGIPGGGGLTTIWSADFETGNTSQWYLPSASADANAGGGEFDSGIAWTTPSQLYAHSGKWSLEMTIITPPVSATRMFRWLEPRTYNNLYYSVWYYFPQTYQPTNFWNVFQWKSKIASTGQDDPFFIVNVGNRSDGSMFLYLFNWQTRQRYTQTVINVPVRQWFNVSAHYVCAADNKGTATVWQDGIELFDVENVVTRYSNGDCQWSVNNYSDAVTPTPTTIYIDDAAIAVQKSGAPPLPPPLHIFR